jgi:hypothetical protein
MDLLSTIEKQKRRSKTDSNNRNFVCGCGKSYLSYPALYTHIKTKHDGFNPHGTTASSMSSSKKRGRPKKPLEEEIDTVKYLIDLHMYGGSTDIKSELVDSPLYSNIEKCWSLESLKENFLSADDVFAIYLIDTSKMVDPSNFHQIVKFIESFRKCVESLEKVVISSLPEQMDYFIQHYIPLNLPSLDRGLSTKLAVHFSQWLLMKKLTDLKLSLL